MSVTACERLVTLLTRAEERAVGEAQDARGDALVPLHDAHDAADVGIAHERVEESREDLGRRREPLLEEATAQALGRIGPGWSLPSSARGFGLVAHAGHIGATASRLEPWNARPQDVPGAGSYCPKRTID